MADSYGWSLSPDDWQLIPKKLEGVAWKMTLLNRLFQDDVPEMAGLYMIFPNAENLTDFYLLPDKVTTIVYIGRTENLRRRFLEHSSHETSNPRLDACKRIFGDLYYAFTRVPRSVRVTSNEWLIDTEKFLLEALHPIADRTRSLVGRVGTPVPVR